MLLIKNAHIRPMAGEDIANGEILIDGGKIAGIGVKVDAPEDAEIIYAEGRLAGDERSTRHIPERGRAAVAKNDFIPVGDGEELSKTLANGPDELLDRRLAVGGAEQLGGAGVESLHLLRADFARTGAEPTIPWKHGFGNCYCIAHAC